MVTRMIEGVIKRLTSFGQRKSLLGRLEVATRSTLENGTGRLGSSTPSFK